MSIFNGYQSEEYAPRIEEGKHLFTIKKVQERVSKNSGNQLLDVELHTKNGARVFYRIVKNDYFNQNLTKFYDCFGIPRGNQNLQSWCGRTGEAFVALGTPLSNGNRYMEVKYLIVDRSPQEEGAGQNRTSQQQSASKHSGSMEQPNSAAAGPGFDDDIPF